MTKTKRIAAAVTSCALLGALALGGTMAYLTDSESQKNEFTFGTIEVDLVEESFAENADISGDTATYNTELVPCAVAEKDPKVVNSGSADAVVFLQVEVPNFNIQTVNSATGAAAAAAATDIYALQFSDGTALTLTNGTATGSGKNWYLVAAPATASNVTTYVFGYNAVLSADDATDVLFDQIQLVNMTDGAYATVTASAVAKDIVVTAYGIQATGLDSISGVDVSDGLSATELSSIWTAYNAGTNSAVGVADTDGKLDLKGDTIGS